MTQEDTNNLCSLNGIKSCSLKLAEHVFKRLSKHFGFLKKSTRPPQTKAKWIEEAFLEKLDAESEMLSDDIVEEKFLHFKINHSLYEKIDQRVNHIKKFRNFSKKQWMLEALYEKLEKEEQKTKQIMQTMLNATKSEKI